MTDYYFIEIRKVKPRYPKTSHTDLRGGPIEHGFRALAGSKSAGLAYRNFEARNPFCNG
jgi:hypothetical protein